MHLDFAAGCACCGCHRGPDTHARLHAAQRLPAQLDTGADAGPGPALCLLWGTLPEGRGGCEEWCSHSYMLLQSLQGGGAADVLAVMERAFSVKVEQIPDMSEMVACFGAAVERLAAGRDAQLSGLRVGPAAGAAAAEARQ